MQGARADGFVVGGAFEDYLGLEGFVVDDVEGIRVGIVDVGD